MKKYYRSQKFKTLEDGRSDRILQTIYQWAGLCRYCGRYEGCNGGGRSGLPSFKTRRWKSWKHNRKTKWK